MGKNIFRERMEQLKISEAETYKKSLEEAAELVEILKNENATLKERLRLVKIAASDGGE